MQNVAPYGKQQTHFERSIQAGLRRMEFA